MPPSGSAWSSLSAASAPRCSTVPSSWPSGSSDAVRYGGRRCVFQPLFWSLALALIVSLLVGLSVTPVLAYLLLPREPARRADSHAAVRMRSDSPGRSRADVPHGARHRCRSRRWTAGTRRGIRAGRKPGGCSDHSGPGRSWCSGTRWPARPTTGPPGRVEGVRRAAHPAGCREWAVISAAPFPPTRLLGTAPRNCGSPSRRMPNFSETRRRSVTSSRATRVLRTTW